MAINRIKKAASAAFVAATLGSAPVVANAQQVTKLTGKELTITCALSLHRSAHALIGVSKSSDDEKMKLAMYSLLLSESWLKAALEKEATKEDISHLALSSGNSFDTLKHCYSAGEVIFTFEDPAVVAKLREKASARFIELQREVAEEEAGRRGPTL